MDLRETFCQACILGVEKKVEEMLKNQPQLVNARGSVRKDHMEYMTGQKAERGWSALHLAAHYGQSEIVKVLIKNGADLNALSDNRQANTPLMAAIAGGNFEIVRMLVKAGADPRKYDGDGKFNAIKLAELDEKSEIAQFLRENC